MQCPAFVMRPKHKQPTETAKRKYIAKHWNSNIYSSLSLALHAAVNSFHFFFFQTYRHIDFDSSVGKKIIFNIFLARKPFVCFDSVEFVAICASYLSCKVKIKLFSATLINQLRNWKLLQTNWTTKHHAVIKRIFFTIFWCIYVTHLSNLFSTNSWSSRTGFYLEQHI